MKKMGREKKAAAAKPARKPAAKSVAAKAPAAKKAAPARKAPTRAVGMKGLASGRPAVLPQHPMSAEQDRFEDEDGPFDEGVL